MVGHWMVSAIEEWFGEGGAFVAATDEGGSYVLAVRCIQWNLSIGIIDAQSDPKPLKERDILA